MSATSSSVRIDILVTHSRQDEMPLLPYLINRAMRHLAADIKDATGYECSPMVLVTQNEPVES